jgi:threonine dehydrogenase-like Zn-dependent dehydrogenase
LGTQQSIDTGRSDSRARFDHRDRRCPSRRGAVRVLTGTIDPGLVLDFETDLDGTPEAYAAMDERRAIKSLIRVGSP